ncbi:MAG: acetoacetate decarboxylase family protein [Thaumarchaeota archaeon]|nr:acetoacetate decarboxylase family protein [Nitrososphaerota archaeon]
MIDHPFVPGDSSAIERGPWHYGADYLTAYFRADRSKLQGLVPHPFQVGDGTGIAYVCEIVSVSDNGAGMVADRPDRTVYSEAAVGLRCTFGGRPGVFFPVMWVTTEFSLMRGLLNGYQKRLADMIAMSRLHPLNPGLKPEGPGTSLSGFCMKGREVTVSVKVEIERAGTPEDLPPFGTTFGYRRFPQTDPTQGFVDEPVEILKSNSTVSRVWVGSGEASCSLGIGDLTVTSGAAYSSGFTISGSKVLATGSNR